MRNKRDCLRLARTVVKMVGSCGVCVSTKPLSVPRCECLLTGLDWTKLPVGLPGPTAKLASIIALMEESAHSIPTKILNFISCLSNDGRHHDVSRRVVSLSCYHDIKLKAHSRAISVSWKKRRVFSKGSQDFPPGSLVLGAYPLSGV
jgi:hypothetical protein